MTTIHHSPETEYCASYDVGMTSMDIHMIDEAIPLNIDRLLNKKQGKANTIEILQRIFREAVTRARGDMYGKVVMLNINYQKDFIKFLEGKRYDKSN